MTVGEHVHLNREFDRGRGVGEGRGVVRRPTSPCSSPEKNTSRTGEASSTSAEPRARAMASRAEVPDPSSSPPGAVVLPNVPRES